MQGKPAFFDKKMSASYPGIVDTIKAENRPIIARIGGYPMHILVSETDANGDHHVVLACPASMIPSGNIVVLRDTSFVLLPEETE